MSIVSITQASKLSGKSVRTLHRHLANGRLSYVMTDSVKGIDTSELIRAYGTIMADIEDIDKKQMASHDTAKSQSKDKMASYNDRQYQHQIELLKLELEAEKRLSNERLQTIEAKQETIDTLKSALKLLEYKQTKDDIGNTDPIPDKEPEPPLNEVKNTESEKGLLRRFKKLFR